MVMHAVIRSFALHHLQDQAILRKAHGLKQISALQYTKTTAKAKKRLAAPDGAAAAVKVSKEEAPAAGVVVYHPGIQSAIAVLQSSVKISSRSKKTMPPGTNKGIPLARQKYCEFCHQWAVGDSRHQSSQFHATNVRLGITWFWCYTCEDSVLASTKQSHVCAVD